MSIRSDLKVLPNDVGWLRSISDLKFMTKRLHRYELLIFVALSISLEAIMNTSLFGLLTGESDKSTNRYCHLIGVLLDKFSNLLIFFYNINFVSIISDETSTLCELLDELPIVITNSYIGNPDLFLIQVLWIVFRNVKNRI